MTISTSVLSNLDVSHLDERLFDARRRLRVLPSAVYDEIDPVELRVWCHCHGIYGLPTTELVDWLRDRIAGRKAIEIGSGNGALGRALGILRTDSFIQEEPRVQALYRSIGQPPVKYGVDVQRYEAQDAVRRFKAAVVVGCWVTHWIDPNKPPPPGGGCMFGPKEDVLFARPYVQTYIVVGNKRVHGHKPLLALPHEVVQAPWIRSRASFPEDDCIYVWDKECEKREVTA